MLTHVHVQADEAELAADALWTAGASAVEERDNADGTVTLVSDVVPEGPWRVDVEPVADDGLDGWRPFARAWRAGPDSRLIVQPPWADPLADARPDDIVLVIDPGRSFGSGSHPTTRLALSALETHVAAGTSVLDVGCGSGVLAIAAARLGAQHVLAIDIDDAAMGATAHNAAANNVSRAIEVTSRPLDEIDGRYDIVAANIGVRAFRALAQDLIARVAEGGRLVISGFLAADRPCLVEAFAGVSVMSEAEEEGWLLLVLS